MNDDIPASDTFATPTMAEIYLAQGHTEEALDIFRKLAERSPEDMSLRKRVAVLEQRLGTEQREQRVVDAIARLKRLLRRVERRRRQVEGA